MSALSDALRKIAGGVGNAINNAGNALGNKLPELGISEKLQAIGGKIATPAYADNGQVLSAQTNTPARSGGTSGGAGAMVGYPVASGGSKSGAVVPSGGSPAPSGGGSNMDDVYGGQREDANDQARRALEAALGVFNAKADNLRSQIPGLEAARDLRIRGLDEGQAQFDETSAREEAARLASIDQNSKEVQDQYGTAERKTRASAKTLANRLRNVFAGAGTLDSSQYKDMNIDQSKEILQSLGDIRREGAGKLAVSGKEKDDLSKYYGEQKSQFSQKTILAKDTARAETDANIRGIMGDINLNDAQKIEQVTDAQNRLDQRLASIDESQSKFKISQEKDAQDLALKLAELKQKGTSSAYNDTLKVQKSLTSAVDVVNKISQNMPGASRSTIAAQVFSQYPELKDIDPASLFGASYTGKSEDDQLSTLYGGGS